MEALITQIQRFSVGDGPGIRSTVFFKGCNLHCPWCHNPETISPKPQLMLYKSRCVLCGSCAQICDKHEIGAEGHNLRRKLCLSCGECANVCAAGALSLCGMKRTVPQLMDTLLEDRDFYQASGGGVTLSGGEPLLQAEVCTELAAVCKKAGINVLLDTAGNVSRDAFDKVLPWIDMCYFDLKSGREAGYSAFGGSLSRTIENLTYVAGKVQTVARIPVIPGFNDSPQEAERMAELLKQTQIVRADLLPFHRMGAGKYEALGLGYAYAEEESMKPSHLDTLLDIFRCCGLHASKGG